MLTHDITLILINEICYKGINGSEGVWMVDFNGHIGVIKKGQNKGHDR